MSMYCVKCKNKTDTTQVSEARSKNNRRMAKGVCKVCGCKKCQFIGERVSLQGLGLAPLGSKGGDILVGQGLAPL